MSLLINEKSNKLKLKDLEPIDQGHLWGNARVYPVQTMEKGEITGSKCD